MKIFKKNKDSFVIGEVVLTLFEASIRVADYTGLSLPDAAEVLRQAKSRAFINVVKADGSK